MHCADQEPRAEALDAEGTGGPVANATPAAAAPAASMNGLRDASAVSIDTNEPDPHHIEHPAEHAVPQRTDAMEPEEPVSVLQPAGREDEQIAEAYEPVSVSEPAGQQDVEMSEAKVPTDAPEELLEHQVPTETPMEA